MRYATTQTAEYRTNRPLFLQKARELTLQHALVSLALCFFHASLFLLLRSDC